MQVFRHIPARAPCPAALTIGNFDGVHRGHRAILDTLRQKAQEKGLQPGVITFEPHPREFFSPATAPARLTSLREKLELFNEAGMGRVYLLRFNLRFAAISAPVFMQQLIDRLDTRLMLVGKDFRFGAGRTGDVATLRAAGLNVESVPTVALDGQRISSTAVRAALAAGELKRANQLLGRPYSISGHVAHGDKLGRQLGYPTANIHMRHERPPLYGIYAVKLHGIDEIDLPGVASLGVRPTTKHQGRPTLEVHLFDFNRDIYGRHVRVQFLEKLRDEQKFPDLETLKRQIATDEQAARNYFKNEK